LKQLGSSVMHSSMNPNSVNNSGSESVMGAPALETENPRDTQCQEKPATFL